MQPDPVPSDVPSPDDTKVLDPAHADEHESTIADAIPGWTSLESEADRREEGGRIDEEHQRRVEGARRAVQSRQSWPLPDPSNVGTLYRYLVTSEELKQAARNAEGARNLDTWEIHDRLNRCWEIIERTPGYRELASYIGSVLGQEVNPEAIKEVERRLAKLRHATLMDVRSLSLVEAVTTLLQGEQDREPPARLIIRRSPASITLDGVPLECVTAEQAAFVDILYKNVGHWVKPAELKGDTTLKDYPRRDRIYSKLPDPIRQLIESAPGAGYKLTLPPLA